AGFCVSQCGMRSAECEISGTGRSPSDPPNDTPHSAFHTPHYLAPTLTLRTMPWLTSPETWIALLTLTLLEIVLGIDNIVFISILAGKLPAGAQKKTSLVRLRPSKEHTTKLLALRPLIMPLLLRNTTASRLALASRP